MDASIVEKRGWFSVDRLVLALAAIPFAAALAFHAVPAKARQAEPGPARPALVFDQYLVNVGDSSQTQANYRFMNMGKAPVEITKLEPSCGCLHPKLKKWRFLPGEIGEFSLAVVPTREKPGPNEYWLTLDYNDPQPRS